MVEPGENDPYNEVRNFRSLYTSRAFASNEDIEIKNENSWSCLIAGLSFPFLDPIDIQVDVGYDTTARRLSHTAPEFLASQVVENDTDFTQPPEADLTKSVSTPSARPYTYSLRLLDSASL
jgi:hypothetical protein